jgi:hypothetical protein
MNYLLRECKSDCNDRWFSIAVTLKSFSVTIYI